VRVLEARAASGGLLKKLALDKVVLLYDNTAVPDPERDPEVTAIRIEDDMPLAFIPRILVSDIQDETSQLVCAILIISVYANIPSPRPVTVTETEPVDGILLEWDVGNNAIFS